MGKVKFEIVISTKNRKNDLRQTLESLKSLLIDPNVLCVVYDDGSQDGTSEMVATNFPQVKLLRNDTSKGYLYCRNFMLSNSTADYAISLDDDANFVTDNPLELISDYFSKNPTCGVLAFRIFWGLVLPTNLSTVEVPHRVKGFVGCGHVWNLKAWQQIPNYPEWFGFYGEEEFASYQLFKNGFEVHYLPQIMVHHRVSMLHRKKDSDYGLRQRRSLRSGWYLYFLYYPWSKIPRAFGYSLWQQIKYKVVKGDFTSTKATVLALGDLVYHFPRILKENNRLTSAEFKSYNSLEITKLYWNPTIITDAKKEETSVLKKEIQEVAEY